MIQTLGNSDTGNHGHAAYSYRDDPSVPDFADDKPVIIFDGECAFCSGWAQFVLKHDKRAIYRLATAQSPLGQALYRHYGLDPTTYETNLLVQEGRIRVKSDASIRMAGGLGFPWSLATIFRIVPIGILDRLYDLIARNRFRIMGRRSVCYAPSDKDRDRFLA